MDQAAGNSAFIIMVEAVICFTPDSCPPFLNLPLSKNEGQMTEGILQSVWILGDHKQLRTQAVPEKHVVWQHLHFNQDTLWK